MGDTGPEHPQYFTRNANMAQKAARYNGALATLSTVPQSTQLANDHINLRNSASADHCSQADKSHGIGDVSSNSKHTAIHDETSGNKWQTPLTQFPELISLIETWPSLPPAIRVGILAMIQTFVTTRSSKHESTVTNGV